MPNHEEILGSLVHYDLVGFQTDNDRDNFAHYLTSLGAKPVRNASFTLDGRQTRLGAFPVGIETAVYARLARNAVRSRFVREMVESLNGQKLVLGVDRLD
jgi:trehalose 6-phosphate synthase